MRDIMEDVQNHPAGVSLPIDRVGVTGLQFPLVVNDRIQGRQHTVADIDLTVDLPARFKGTHMSRFVEALEEWTGEVSYSGMKKLLEDVKLRLNARRAHIIFRFPYFIRKEAPVSGSPGIVSYQCCLTGDLEEGKPQFTLEIAVPVMTVCPCSKAISDEGAHSQRAIVKVKVEMGGFSWIEEFIELAEKTASSPVYTSLKRSDEKYVTEQAFAHPAFVEDVVRAAALPLTTHPQVKRFVVEVESIESIHNHNAYARIEGKGGHA